MTTIKKNTPILIGVGQVTEAISAQQDDWICHADLAARAATLALADTGVDLVSHIDAVAGVKTFADSSPAHVCPFGMPNNFPRAVANRIGADPEYVVYEVLGGQAPQQLVGEFAEKLWRGDHDVVLLTGSEVIAHIKSAQRAGVQLDWEEQVDGQLDDRGLTGGDPVITRMEFEHKLMLPMQFYGMIENARRYNLKQNEAEYSRAMAAEFSKLSEVAATNPLAFDQNAYSPETIGLVDEKNPLIVSPYPKKLIAKDNVNQAAALLMTTVGKAEELGIDESHWIYLHTYTDLKERVLLERDNLGQSVAMELSLREALKRAQLTAEQVKHFDIYSCFPVVVSNARDILGIDVDDSRSLTVTGGLAYFGGPGNNYSMHGIASMVETLRSNRGDYGLVYANGGVMSKHSVGIYSSTAPTVHWQPTDSTDLQAELNNRPLPGVDYAPNGEAMIETYTINYAKGQPMSAALVVKMLSNGKRCFALTDIRDADTFNELLASDPLGRAVFVASNPKGNQFAFSQSHLLDITPIRIETLQAEYEYCEVERRGKILIVTINRPEVRNALNPMANEELQGIFNAYEKDDDLWVAILTGKGRECFSAGNDLKYMAMGGELWIPETGFAGLTSRENRVKPIIAAVNGPAMGGGLEIAMACDIIIAVDHASFALPEVKVGLIAAAGGIQRLPRHIGLKPAMHMMLTGEAIGADKAQSLGLVNAVVPYQDLIATAVETAEKIVAASPTSVRCTLDLHNQSSQYGNVDEAINSHYDVFDKLLNSEDFFEGPKAFAMKRPPKWTGK